MWTNYLVPREDIEPEVEAQLRTQRILINEDAFQPHIKKEDIESKDLPQRDKKVLFSMSVVEAKLDFVTYAIQLANHYARMVEADMVRERMKRQREADANTIENRRQKDERSIDLQDAWNRGLKKVILQMIQWSVVGVICIGAFVLLKHFVK